jgi:hypothetical protein
VRLDVNPVLPTGVALESPDHAGGESNGRAVRLTRQQFVKAIADALNPAELGAAVAGEG